MTCESFLHHFLNAAMRNPLRCILVIALVLQVTLPLQAIGDLETLRHTAQTLYRNGNYDEATKLYVQIAADFSKDIGVLKEAMWALWNMQSFNNAVRLATQVQALKPDDVEAGNILSWARTATNRDRIHTLREEAVSRYQAGRYGEAATTYRELVDLEPNNISTLKDWMSALWAAHEYAETNRAAHQILTLRPNDPQALELLQQLPSRIAEEKLREIEVATSSGTDVNQPQLTIKLDELLVKLNPSEPASYRNLAWAYYRLGRYTEARVIASLLTTLAPDDPSSWSLLAKTELGLNQTDEAIANYEKSLGLDPHQASILLTLGKIHLEQREFAVALPYLQKAADIPGPHQVDALPLLGKTLYYLDRYSDSAAIWQEAAQRFPDRPEFQFQYAMALYYSDQRDTAMTILKKLYEDTHYDPAASFVSDDYYAHGDVASAEQVLEDSIAIAPSLDEARAMRLAGLYVENGPKKKLIPLLDRILHVYPNHLEAMITKANALVEQQKYGEAKKLYEQLLELDPYYLEGIRNLAETEESLGRTSAAVALAKRLRQWDPTNLEYALFEARLLYDRQDYMPAKRILQDWLKAYGDSTILTILCYHGLTPLSTDPMLAYPYHHSTAVFEDHLKALKAAGYTPVTTSEVDQWLDKRLELPKKPILMTFDDARMDSFKYATPLLQKYGFKAAMMVAIVNLEGHMPAGYASWSKLMQYKKTGVWEMQAHGDIAHVREPVDANGLKGPFLANRMWLESENRMESEEEWKLRIAKDYESNRQKLFDHTGVTPIAYAYPESVYGQQDQTNVPTAALANRALVMQYFRMGFVQDPYGMNMRNAERAFLTRLEPNNKWTGQQLVDHLRDFSPPNRVYVQLMDWAIDGGRVQEAYSWWKRLKDNGVSENFLASREAIIRLTAGDYAEGHALAQRALMGESVPEVKKTILDYLQQQRWAWIPAFHWHTEDPSRTDWWAGQTFEFPRLNNGLRFFGTYRYEQYNQAGFPFISGQTPGVGLNYPLGISHEFSLLAMQHLFSGPASNEMEIDGAWKSQWTDNFSTQVSGAQQPEPNAQALNSDIMRTEGEIQGHWIKDAWISDLSERFRHYSDTNERTTTDMDLGRSLIGFLNLRAVVHVVYDATQFRAPQYYSPQSLWQYGLGPEISGSYRWLNWAVRYWPAYSQEHDISDEWDQNVEAELEFHLGASATLKPSYSFYQSPGYTENTVELECAIPF